MSEEGGGAPPGRGGGCHSPGPPQLQLAAEARFPPYAEGRRIFPRSRLALDPWTLRGREGQASVRALVRRAQAKTKGEVILCVHTWFL